MGRQCVARVPRVVAPAVIGHWFSRALPLALCPRRRTAIPPTPAVGWATEAVFGE
ncbi:MAG: hypothetical protein KME31_28390 [Tolypothrix carrinoi HA7290-LM1]|nr:hypothetical protein [Tolypothrix carrinoi HA7290-LM1]